MTDSMSPVKEQTHLQTKRICSSSTDIVSITLESGGQPRMMNTEMYIQDPHYNVVRAMRFSTRKQSHGMAIMQCEKIHNSSLQNSPILTGDHNVSLMIKNQYHGNHGCILFVQYGQYYWYLYLINVQLYVCQHKYLRLLSQLTLVTFYSFLLLQSLHYADSIQFRNEKT